MTFAILLVRFGFIGQYDTMIIILHFFFLFFLFYIMESTFLFLIFFLFVSTQTFLFKYFYMNSIIGF